MVKWLSRGEFPIFRFIKDLGKFGILRRKFLLNFSVAWAKAVESMSFRM